MPNPNNTEATNAILKKENLGETPEPAKDYLNSTGILEESALPYISYILKEGGKSE